MPTGPSFAHEIRQMMYVAGETRSDVVSVETVRLMESIIKIQVQHLINAAAKSASWRRSPVVSTIDIVFQFRKDTKRVERVKKFLVSKSLRRASGTEDEDVKGGSVDANDAMQGGAGHAADGGKILAPSITFPWELDSLYRELPPGPVGLAADEEQHATNLDRLRAADHQTLEMSLSKYMKWSECRQASFTGSNSKKFRDWCELNHMVSGDDLDLLGLLASEMVDRLTKIALELRRNETGEGLVGNGNKETEMGGFAALMGCEQKGSPVRLDHIHQAYELTQRPQRMGAWTKIGLCII